jgi:hypothetical protein
LIFYFSKISFSIGFFKIPPLPQKYIIFFLLPQIFFSAAKNAQKNEKKGGLPPLPSWAESWRPCYIS